MAMGKHKKRQEALWVPTSDLPRSPGHPFYSRLNRALESEGFDRFVESRCRRFYAAVLGRPSLAPGRYFRLLLVGYFEGLDSERGMAWRAADSLGVRSFLGLGLEERAPEHSTISRTRRLIDLETHRDRVHLDPRAPGADGSSERKDDCDRRDDAGKRTRRCGASCVGIPERPTRSS